MKFSLFKKRTPFLPIYQHITDRITAGTLLTPDGNKFAYNTARNYRAGIVPIEGYQNRHGPIYLETFDPDKFAVFMMDEGYCKNTIAVTLSRIKAVLHRQGIKLEIHAPIEQTTTVYNTIEDLRTLMDVDLSDSPGNLMISPA